MRPAGEGELGEAIADLAARGGRARLRGGGSTDAVGAPCHAAVMDLSAFAGVADYDPAELVLTVRPATPLADVQALVADHGQMLAFDPHDHGRDGVATVGGVMAAGVSGSLRLSGGAPRDHLLGFRAVSGRGEAFAAGAKVVKNVTGYDLPKLAAGSWGRLFALTEMTLKTVPRPPTAATLTVAGLGPAAAVRAMAAAMGSRAEVAAAAHLPGASRADGRPLTALRVTGFGPSVRARAAMLTSLLSEHGSASAMNGDEDAIFWDELRGGALLPAEPPLWRINVPPSRSPALVAALEPLGAAWAMDWAGGLVWAATAGDPAAVRAAAGAGGGHATLVRAPAAVRATAPAFHPPAPGVAALEERVRRAFDPAGVFECGRF